MSKVNIEFPDVLKSRKIKFRGKNNNGIWVFGYYIYNSNLNKHYIITFNGKKVEVIYKTVNQYIGFNDNTKWEELTEKEQKNWLKNNKKDEWKGKEIYEHDILEYDSHKPYLLRYENGAFIVDGLNKTYKTFALRDWYNYRPELIKVLGNIHDPIDEKYKKIINKTFEVIKLTKQFRNKNK